MQHIPRRHGAQAANLLDTTLPRPAFLRQQIHHRLRPIRPIAQQAQIAQRFLRAPQLALTFTELVTKRNQQLPKPHALKLWECKDTSDVIPFCGFFFLAEVPDEVAPVLIPRSHAVEQEGIDVVIQGFMIEEEFRQEAKIPTPPPLPPSINLEKTHIIVAIDLVPRGVQKRALGSMSLKLLQGIVITEAEFANVDHVRFGEAGRVRAEVPRFHFVFAHLDALEVAHAGDFGLILRHAAAGAEFFDFFLAGVRALGGGGASGFGGGGGILEVGDVDVFAVVVGFWGTGCNFGGDHRDGLVAARTVVFFAADERRTSRRMRLGVAGCGR